MLLRRHHELGWNFFGFDMKFKPPPSFSTNLSLRHFRSYGPRVKLFCADPLTNLICCPLGSNVTEVFDRLARGINAVEESIFKECGKKFMLDPRYGYIHSCPTNLGTGMRASVHVTLPGNYTLTCLFSGLLARIVLFVCVVLCVCAEPWFHQKSGLEISGLKILLVKSSPSVVIKTI